MYQEKFGFCSLAHIKDPERAAGYITKYVSKDLARCISDYGAHMYRCSIGLARAMPMGYVYQSYASLDVYLGSDNTFCSTGWVRDVDWSFWMEYIPADDELPPLEYPEDMPVLLSNVEIQQTTIGGWLEGENDGGKR